MTSGPNDPDRRPDEDPTPPSPPEINPPQHDPPKIDPPPDRPPVEDPPPIIAGDPGEHHVRTRRL